MRRRGRAIAPRGHGDDLLVRRRGQAGLAAGRIHGAAGGSAAAQVARAGRRAAGIVVAADPIRRLVSVVGAGFAGCATARALAERGFEVSVHDTSVAAGRFGDSRGGCASAVARGPAAARLRCGRTPTDLPYMPSTGWTASGRRAPCSCPARTATRHVSSVSFPALPADWIAAVSPGSLGPRGHRGRRRGTALPPCGTGGWPNPVPRPPGSLAHSTGRGPPAGPVNVLASASRITERLPELEVAPLEGQADLFRGPVLRVPVLGDGYAAPARPSGESWVGRPTSTGVGRQVARRPRTANAIADCSGSRRRRPWRCSAARARSPPTACPSSPDRCGHVRHRRPRLERHDDRRVRGGVDREPDRRGMPAGHPRGGNPVPLRALPRAPVAAAQPIQAGL